ncbi:MAG: alpha/beta hydrolase [Verrucomicrobiales bacterium]|nr:alpha/beta hydrolase [Verrucomicrobiales bacterium]
MGADDRVFAPQQVEFPHLIVPKWIEPKRGESLPDYARRFAAKIDPGEPCFIGGASFGGMLAVEMMPHLEAKACILIGSVSHPDQLPPIVKWARPFESITRFIPFKWIQTLMRIFVRIFDEYLSPNNRTILSQAQNSKPKFFRWALRALIEWKRNGDIKPAKIYHIHGENDPLLPLRYVTPDEVVEDGWHVISLRNGAIVNRFIHEVMTRSSAPEN